MQDVAQHAQQSDAQHAQHAGQDDHQEPAGGWLTIAEAAAALGVSVDTVRRRVRRGELAAEQVQTERGPVWRLSVHAVPSVLSTPSTSVPGTPSSNGHSTLGTPGSAAEHAMHDQPLRPELLKALELLERAQVEVVAKAEAAAMWQTRAELLAVQLQQRDRELADAREELRALQAPRPADPTPDALQRDSQGVPVDTTQQPAAPKRPWWRFWG